MRIYLALGRPSRFVLEALCGMRVLESFAFVSKDDERDVCERYRATWAGALLDSGAFSELTGGASIDLGAYIAFCQEHGAAYDAIVNLDDIAGDTTRSWRNFAAMLGAGLRPMPVFHQGEPWSVLAECVAAAPDRYVGIGFQRPIRNARAWLDEVFSRVAPEVRVHGFAMISQIEHGYPFHSVDGSTWIHELAALTTVKGQGADALSYLTPGELLEIVIKKYERLRARRAWKRPAQEALFTRTAAPRLARPGGE